MEPSQFRQNLLQVFSFHFSSSIEMWLLRKHCGQPCRRWRPPIQDFPMTSSSDLCEKRMPTTSTWTKVFWGSRVLSPTRIVSCFNFEILQFLWRFFLVQWCAATVVAGLYRVASNRTFILRPRPRTLFLSSRHLFLSFCSVFLDENV